MVNVVWIKVSFAVITQTKNLSTYKNLAPSLEVLCPFKERKDFSILSDLFLEEDKRYHCGIKELWFCIDLGPKNIQLYR